MWYMVSIHWVIVIIGMHMEYYMRSTTYNILKKSKNIMDDLEPLKSSW